MPVSSPRVFNIPASAPFLPTLIAALRDGGLGLPPLRDPLALASATLYLPTRRACRLARDEFLKLTGADAAILPRIVAIGDIDEDEIVFAQAASPAVLDLPDEIGGLERRLLLTRLIERWAATPELHGEDRAPLIAGTPAAALALADDLARLMDDMATRQVPWERLDDDDVVPTELDDYWQKALRFLKIASEQWPKHLKENNKIEPAARRDLLIAAEAERLAAHADGPVIAAGSTGSIPATAALIAAIAKLPHGAVVLPGLDTTLDDASWTLIAGSDGTPPAAGHPQFAMQALLSRIGIARGAVERLAPTGGSDRLASEAFRPAAATELWRARVTDAVFTTHAAAALEQMSFIEAANPEEEALAIAVALREAVDNNAKSAALVTPDRALARRVVAALERWQVPVDDSGGDALPDTHAGVFARLAAEATLDGLPPARLLALLKHPLLRLGATAGAHARAIATLERAILRGPRPRPGSDGLCTALAAFREELAKLRRGERCDLHPFDQRTTLRDGDLQAAANLVVELIAALAPLECLRNVPHAFAELAQRHANVVAQLSDEGAGIPAAFAGADGAKLAEAFDDIAACEPAADLRVTLADYVELFHTAVADRVVRRAGQPGVRVRILGPLEARLAAFDRVVLGGLNEGSWPPETKSDAWLSRPMRLALGLDLPERRISLSAHDFAQMLGARETILTRATKAGGAPTVASRFVQRLAAVAGEGRWKTACENGERYVHWARALDRPAEIKRIAQPAPKPPREARPLSLSVTEIEHWLRDPYTIYARHILKLRELDPVDLAPGAADRGIVIHAAIGEFAQTYAAALPADPEAALIEIGRKHFATVRDYPEATAFWWPRYLRIARWFARWETRRRANVASLAAEIRGEIAIPLGDREFKLRTRADRIERRPDGRYAILDYKTGVVPTEKQVRVGISPQLTLEAAILRGGGFTDLAPASIAELVYVSLKGGAVAGDAISIGFKDGDADSHAAHALAKLTEVAIRFEDPAQPYRPLILSMWKTRYGAYDHLARVKEWSVGGEEGDGE